MIHKAKQKKKEIADTLTPHFPLFAFVFPKQNGPSLLLSTEITALLSRHAKERRKLRFSLPSLFLLFFSFLCFLSPEPTFTSLDSQRNNLTLSLFSWFLLRQKKSPSFFLLYGFYSQFRGNFTWSAGKWKRHEQVRLVGDLHGCRMQIVAG